MPKIEYSDSLQSGASLKAEVKRASVMARKSMARVNMRKFMAKEQREAAEVNIRLSQDSQESLAAERRSHSSLNSDGDIVARADSEQEASLPYVAFESEGEKWNSEGDESYAKDMDTEHQQSLRTKIPSRMYSYDDDRSVARAPMQSLNWIDMAKVEMGVIVLIILNMYCLALETDYPTWPWWDLVNGAFLVVYVGEFSLRMLQKGPIFLLLHARTTSWHWYDLILILLGVADIFVACQSAGSCRGADHWVSSAGHEHAMICADAAVVRFLMLCRLLRAVRIVRMIPPLYFFVKQLVSMITGTISWILLVIFLFCFVLAIIFTRLLGHGLLLSGTETDQVTVRNMFQDVPSSLFALFQLTTADDWARIALPVISARTHPVAQFIWRLFFIFFITFMSWTMLSLLTAVASEEMMTLKTNRKADEVLRQELERQGLINFLCDEFERADIDENGVLDKQEFLDLMTQENFRLEMKNHGLSLEERDVGKTWDTFDVDESGELTIEELVYGFSYLQEGLATKHVASIGYALKRNQISSERQFSELETEFELINQSAEKVLESLDQQQLINQHQWNAFLAHQSDKAMMELKEETQANQDDILSRSATTSLFVKKPADTVKQKIL